MAQASASVSKRDPFRWELSEKTICWPSIMSGQLGFHILGVATSPTNQRAIYLSNTMMDSLSLALDMGPIRICFTDSHRMDLGMTVFDLISADDSTDPTELATLCTERPPDSPGGKKRASIELDTLELNSLRRLLNRETDDGEPLDTTDYTGEILVSLLNRETDDGEPLDTTDYTGEILVSSYYY